MKRPVAPPPVEPIPAPGPADVGRTVLLTVRDGRGGTTEVPIRVLPGPRSPEQDAALVRLGASLVRKLRDRDRLA